MGEQLDVARCKALGTACVAELLPRADRSYCAESPGYAQPDANSIAHHSNISHQSQGHVPDGRAGLGGLAEEEADLLEGLGEGVFARHGGRGILVRSGDDGCIWRGRVRPAGSPVVARALWLFGGISIGRVRGFVFKRRSSWVYFWRCWDWPALEVRLHK